MFWSDYISREFFSIALFLITVIFIYFQWNFTYWKRRNIPYLPPKFPLGNMENIFKSNNTIGVMMQNLYNEIKQKNVKHAGVYFVTEPYYFVTDLDYVRNVLSKDFQYFTDRVVYYNEELEPIGAHLFALCGTKWRNLRAKLSPTFTSGKMKIMFQTMLDCIENLHERIEISRRKNQAIDMREALNCFTIDIIGSVAFGLDCNSFKEENSPFRKFGKKALNHDRLGWARVVFLATFPKLARILKLRFFTKDVNDFFVKIVKDTVEYREKNEVRRNDFMQSLIDLVGTQTLTVNEATAQSFLFFLAGFETSSTTMTFALYELAKNQNIQRKVREEINEVLAKCDGKMTYEALHKMKYLQQVIDETLRKYPPLPFINRQCVKNYKISDEDIVIEKGTRITISILGIHHDSDHYPDPQRFDPERFNEENSKSRHPFAYIPFGEGPRICIALRFGIMQTKVGLISLLQKYKFTVNERTQEPLKFSISSFALTAEGGIWLNAEKI